MTALDMILGSSVVLASLAAVFILGVWLGQRSQVQRKVDAALRRETRFRHPTASHTTAVAEMTGVMPRGRSMREVLEGAERVQEAIRRAGTPLMPEKTLSVGREADSRQEPPR